MFFYRKKVTSNVTIILSKTDILVLDQLKENPKYTIDDIALKINKTVRTVQRSIDKLKQNGQIRRVGAKNNGYWEIIE